MRLSQFHLHTSKQTPSDAEIVSHQLMLRAGMVRRLAAGIYTWSPLGLRVLRKVEAIVRQEMDRAGAVELLMPCIQPRELWDESGRWGKYGPMLLKMHDRKEQDFCYAPTAEEVITDFARNELASYKQLPVNFYQIQTKFRDEIRPRFGVMRAREFLMKDAYSFDLDEAGMDRSYRNMQAAYIRVFERLGLRFRAVQADSGEIGGDTSQEFHVLADSGEDAIAFSDGSDYAANVETATAAAPDPRPAAAEAMQKVDTPTQETCEAVATLLDIPLACTVKSIAVMGRGNDGEGEGDEQSALALVRGDHTINAIKLAKLPELANYRLATEAEILAHLGSKPGFLGPVSPRQPIRVIADRSVAAMADFVVGANQPGFHLAGVNWGRDLPEPDLVADIRNVVAGDPSPDGNGTLGIARGIEVGHVFQLGDKYARAMGCNVLDANGKAVTPLMGCYGIGISRIVAAAIEQNFDDNGILWPTAMAPWQVAICMIQPKGGDPAVDAAADTLYRELSDAGIDTVVDDRGLRPGAMFADIELIGIPHRVVVSPRGLEAGTFEYRARAQNDSENLDRATLLARLGARQTTASARSLAAG